jgi:hypothetical protein
MRALWARAFGREDVQAEADFRRLGGDARVARAIADDLAAVFGVDVDAESIDAPVSTPARLAARVAQARVDANGR